MRKTRTESRNDDGADSSAGPSSAGASAGFITSQLTAPSASLCACTAGEARMTFVTSNPLSPKSDIRLTTTEIRRAATIVSPSKRSTPTSVSPFSSTEALGKWRSRLMSSFSKSSRAASMALASRFTMSAILPRSAAGAIRAIARITTTAITAIFTIFFIPYLFYRQKPWFPPP